MNAKNMILFLKQSNFLVRFSTSGYMSTLQQDIKNKSVSLLKFWYVYFQQDFF